MDELRAKLNSETAPMAWSSLARFFARGDTLHVVTGVSLLDVAVAFAEDRSERVEQWMANGEVTPVSDETARAWLGRDAEVWTVVVRPWILVQDMVEE